jgi:predicted RNase H-like HicB family nuclease
MRTFIAVLHKEDNLHVAECPEIGAVSQDRTVEEAVTNLKEAMELYLEKLPLPEVGGFMPVAFEVAV